MIEFPYYSENGVRAAEPPIAIRRGPHVAHPPRRGQPLLLNQAAARRGSARASGTPANSYLGVPDPRWATRPSASSASRAAPRSGRFGEADVRLLSTIAANVGLGHPERAAVRERAAPGGRDGRAGRRWPRDLGDARPRLGPPAHRRAGAALLDGDTSAVFLAEDDGRRLPGDSSPSATSPSGHGRHGSCAARASSATSRSRGAAEMVNDVAQRSARGHIPGTEEETASG